jgi:hypothetical protein
VDRTLSATLDLPVRVADSPEGTGLGAVLLGMHALGQLPDLDDATGARRRARARRAGPEDAALYRRLRPLVEQSTSPSPTSSPPWTHRHRARRCAGHLTGGLVNDVVEPAWSAGRPAADRGARRARALLS